jgi:hypothetical protein
MSPWDVADRWHPNFTLPGDDFLVYREIVPSENNVPEFLSYGINVPGKLYVKK